MSFSRFTLFWDKIFPHYPPALDTFSDSKLFKRVKVLFRYFMLLISDLHCLFALSFSTYNVSLLAQYCFCFISFKMIAVINVILYLNIEKFFLCFKLNL